MRSGSAAPLSSVAVALTVVHAVDTSTEPVIVCTPFLKESRKVTGGAEGGDAEENGGRGRSTRVCGTETMKPTTMTSAMMAAASQGRI